MIARSENFKNELKKLGRQIDFKVNLYSIHDNLTTENDNLLITEDNLNIVLEQLNNEEITKTMQGEDIFNVNVVNNGTILSTMMKEIDFEVRDELKVGDIVDCSFGLKVEDNYEWINFGKYIIYSKEYNEDTQTYSYVSYDGILLTMINLDNRNIVENVSIKTAIENICNETGLNINITASDITNLPNLNKVIHENTFKDIEMTYRDVLDMICQSLGVSIICKDKTLYFKELNETSDTTQTLEDIEFTLENIDINKASIEELKGNTYQITTTGKNLLDCSVGINAYINSSGGLGSGNDNLLSDYIQVDSGSDYTVSLNTQFQNIGYALFDSNKTFVSRQNNNNKKTLTISIPSGSSYLRVWFTKSTGFVLTTTNILQYEPMIEKSSSATTYEIYTGANPSPNSNYPQNIDVVTGLQTIDITGKNLFDKNNANILPLNVNANSISSSQNAKLLYMPINGNTTYTISKILSARFRLATTEVIPANNVLVKGYTQNDNGTSITITTDGASKYLCVYYFLNGTDTLTEQQILDTIQIEVGSTATTYEQYKSQSYKINLGKNLFDKANASVLDLQISTPTIITSLKNIITYIPCKPNTTYTIQKRNDGNTNRFSICTTNEIPAINVATSNIISDNNASSITITTGNNANYLVVQFYRRTDETILTEQQVLDSIQIEVGDKVTTYSPYFTPIELCKIGNYQDYLYKRNGKWYIHKEIGEYTFTGNESVTLSQTANVFYINNSYDNALIDNTSTPLCTIFQGAVARLNASTAGNNANNSVCLDKGTNKRFYFKTNAYSTGSELATGLTGQSIYWIYETPTNTEITNTELINQLETIQNIELFKGTDNITTLTNNLKPYLKLTYSNITGIADVFNEEYLKDVNVTFGKKYGPINSVVLSRSEDNDNLYRKDDESIELNGLQEYKIKDNLIMLYDDREDYIDEIFNKLKNVEYYVNDFSSIGITYLEWLDYYYVTRGENTYKCLLLNDEIKLNQGLEEHISTEEPEEATTDYKKAGKTDKEVSFIVDKQNGEISSKVSKDGVISSINQSAEQISINADKINLNGVVTANNNFKILEDGSMEAVNGKFNGNIEIADTGIEQQSPKIKLSRDNNNYTCDIYSDGLQLHDYINGRTLSVYMPQNVYWPEMITLTQGSNTTFLDPAYIITPSVSCEDLYVSGSKNRIVDIGDRQVLLNAYETPTPYFGDIGSNKTNQDGYCKIDIEEIFSKTIELDDYKVFIQGCGEGNLYVEKYDGYFEVKGTPNLDFDWEIKAIQKGYKDTRLAEYIKRDIIKKEEINNG